jgi:hypothetical protein
MIVTRDLPTTRPALYVLSLLDHHLLFTQHHFSPIMPSTSLSSDLHVKYIQSLNNVCPSPSASFLSLLPHLSPDPSPLPPCLRAPSDSQEADYSYHRSEHLRMNGIYWGLTALCLLDRQDALSREDMVAWVMSCWDEKQGRYVLLSSPPYTLCNVLRLGLTLSRLILGGD